ncbi:TetR/AcrR family transcriptional regulator [Tsuneonella sp. HG249]
MSTLESSYHHGSLRTALIDAGTKVLEGPDGLDISLRELARMVGVSPAAVYRHFPNKDALLAALAQTGLATLGEAQRTAYEKVGGGLSGFVETGRAYVRFALTHPALFRLVFAHGDPSHMASGKRDPASQLLHNSTAELTGSTGPAAERLALRAWSLAHGIAMLMLDKRLPAEDALIDRLIDNDSLFPAEDPAAS